MSNYIFTSQRLGFRNWEKSDFKKMAEINSDKEVMKFFPKTLSETDTVLFIKKMQQQFIEKRFCYFAVDTIKNNEFIGFIGLSEQNYDADFTPCIDIGWRLHKKAWNKGFATEGAKKCLEYAFTHLNLNEIYAIAPKINIVSENVMKKIGLKKVKNFMHPLLLESENLKDCVLYKIENH
ncbi:RimJ/RimL family protein N-acetyltransferase [Lutibacter oceani]|uniref:RimJ/RimL family protein N-acetyltransferase n=1 Tax=Lutibacter oceani TaxID=1853311 RepID=A0A3D9S0T1_9FLAO|nr:GNAT family N-acetyltransferase [Lutibacter oceani]REE83751.1 RimJ/RimL family protein N-acetyltransferase [Lutibacter oceani]